MSFDKYKDKKVCHFVIPILFAPQGSRRLTESYPELNEVPVFRDISDKDLKFVWYHTILYNNVTPEKERVQMAISESYGNIISEEDKNRLISGNWGAKLKEAAAKMSSYDLTARMKNKLMYEQVYEYYQKILKDGYNGEDTEEKKKFVAVTKDIMDVLPQLTKSIESNLGVSEIEMDLLVNNNNLTDGYYSHKKEFEQ